ncbi:MAG: dihydroxyacetone kinase subunit DhaK [Microbacterium gubbeenense]
MQIHDDPARLVHDAVEGVIAESRGALVLVEEPLHVHRRSASGDTTVAVVSGGGSGHEPLHLGLVGPGMLDAAVPGQVFASPTAAQVLAAIESVDRGPGVLLVVKNYTGDVLNFRFAAEDAEDAGHNVEVVVVADDIATESEQGPGRRGTGATLLVEKLAGAAAARGLPLAEVARIARSVADRARSLAVAFRSATLPGWDDVSFALPNGSIEFGVGIHGERGQEVAWDGDGSALVDLVVTRLFEAMGLVAGDEVIALVNGLGGTPALQLGAANAYLRRNLSGRGVDVVRSLTGNLVTALDMQGVSITLLRAGDDDLDLWDAPVRTAALSW